MIATYAIHGTTRSITISEIKAEYETTDWKEYRLYQPLMSSQNVLKQYLAEDVAKYGLDYDKLYNIVNCESSWNYQVIGDSGLAYGLAQFHKSTWDSFSKSYGEKLDYYNPFHQIDLMTWAFSKGLSSHWTCTKLLNYK